ncbi:MAG: metallophosphoesterase family protein [bacterium]
MEPWTFVHINDMQPGSPRSFRFRPAWLENQQQAYKQIKAINPALIIVGGDLTRDGTIHDFEFEQAKANLDALHIPYRAIPGNMDVGNKHTRVQGAFPGRDDVAANMTSEPMRRFAQHFGEFPWTFVHKNVRFTGFYAAVAGSGLPEENALWNFLDALSQQAPTRHHVVVMHYALFINAMDEANFDITDPDQYLEWYFSIGHPHRDRIFEQLKKAHVDIVFSGHIHCHRPVQIVDGIRFYKTAATCSVQAADRWPDSDPRCGFAKLDVTDDQITYNFVPLEQVSQRTDEYGPGGHTKPEDRDYSFAWEQ